MNELKPTKLPFEPVKGAKARFSYRFTLELLHPSDADIKHFEHASDQIADYSVWCVRNTQSSRVLRGFVHCSKVHSFYTFAYKFFGARAFYAQAKRSTSSTDYILHYLDSALFEKCGGIGGVPHISTVIKRRHACKMRKAAKTKTTFYNQFVQKAAPPEVSTNEPPKDSSLPPNE